MKLMDKIWGGLGLLEPVEQPHDAETRPRIEEIDQGSKKRRVSGSSTTAVSNNLVNLPTAQKQMKVMVVEPFAFDDAQHVADYLKNRKPVVVNFENCDKELAKRMIDFISGTTYALGGSIQKVGNCIFLCAPNNVDVAYSSYEDSASREFMPWK